METAGRKQGWEGAALAIAAAAALAIQVAAAGCASTSPDRRAPTATPTPTVLQPTWTRTRTWSHTYTATPLVSPTPPCMTGCVPTIPGVPTITWGAVLFPNTGWQQISGSYAAQEGVQYDFCASSGVTYEFTFCPIGGGSFIGDPYLWLGDSACALDSADDDDCGLGSYLIWPATFTGPAALVVTSCCTGSTSGTYTLAYRNL